MRALLAHASRLQQYGDRQAVGQGELPRGGFPGIDGGSRSRLEQRVGDQLGNRGRVQLVDSTSFGTLLIPVWLMTSRRVRVRQHLLYLGIVAGCYWVLGLALAFRDPPCPGCCWATAWS